MRAPLSLVTCACLALTPLQADVESGHPQFTTAHCVLEDGTSLAYHLRSGHPTLVLVPGTGKSRSVFLAQGLVDRLESRFGIVIIEMRGCGDSWPPPAPEKATMEQYGDDVLAVVRRLNLDAWYLSGHSLGGMITLEVAGRRPAGLRGIIPLEGWVHYSVAARAFNVSERSETNPIGPFAPRVARDIAPGWTNEQEISQIQIWRKWTSGERIVADLEYPMLAVWGDRTLEPRPAQNLLLLPEKSNIELRWIRGAGHNVLAPEFASQVADAINSFVVRIEARHARPTPRGK